MSAETSSLTGKFKSEIKCTSNKLILITVPNVRFLLTTFSCLFWQIYLDRGRVLLLFKRCLNPKTHILCYKVRINFFLLGATTLVESWPSQQFLSVWGDLGLVLSIQNIYTYSNTGLRLPGCQQNCSTQEFYCLKL